MIKKMILFFKLGLLFCLFVCLFVCFFFLMDELTLNDMTLILDVDMNASM
jgi:hypothetical protein